VRRDLNVILDLTSRCNLKCVMCYFSASDRLRFPPFDEEGPPGGNMPLALFVRVADELFPRARRVSLGCAAEPLLHPELAAILDQAARHRVPDLWFPTNLMALTRAKAEAIVGSGVRTVAVSIDGSDAATYEKIRRGAHWDRLHHGLELLAEVRRERGSRLPRLRLIFTWMRSNREHLRRLPTLAQELGACELDVRFASPTTGVDVSAELLEGEDRAALGRELEATARDAVTRGLRLVAYPEYASSHSRSLAGKLRHRAWLKRAGLLSAERRRHAAAERRLGCGHFGTTYVVRPNGTVLPCPFWEAEPIGRFPELAAAELASSSLVEQIRCGLAGGDPVGSCRSCSQLRESLYRPQRVAR